jgi:molybdenum cofactor synthesis domain-containing protein
MSQSVTACVIVIGNEILSGRTQDINLNHIATTLGGWGIQVHHARVIPDDEDIIVNTINEVRGSYDYVFTTGGIGPTHDDITAVCIAKAFGVPIVQHPDIESAFGDGRRQTTSWHPVCSWPGCRKGRH